MTEALWFWPWFIASVLDAALKVEWTEQFVYWVEAKAGLR
jgi:hypothetical protein